MIVNKGGYTIKSVHIKVSQRILARDHDLQKATHASPSSVALMHMHRPEEQR
jgi:hypothetical protein